MQVPPTLTRRHLLHTAAAGALGVSLSSSRRAMGLEPERQLPICVFTKPLQWLSYEQMAETVAGYGVDGIEGTVRPGGHVLPERVTDDLPKMIEALHSHQLKLTIMTSGVNSMEQPHTRTVLETAARLGVKRYRMAYYKYDKAQPIMQQLQRFRGQLRELADFNRELGLTALYQNHAGATSVGAPIWDLHHLLRGIDPQLAGIAFDIRHATVEGGQSWPIQFRLMQPHLGAVFVKDFQWRGRKPVNVPLGKGQVDPRFFSMLRATKFRGPISLHMEYIDHRDRELVKQSVKAIGQDVQTLRGLLRS